MAHPNNQGERKHRTFHDRVLAKIRNQRLISQQFSSTNAQIEQLHSPERREILRMDAALTELVRAIRGRDWYDEPAEREKFMGLWE